MLVQRMVNLKHQKKELMTVQMREILKLQKTVQVLVLRMALVLVPR